jgi:carboxyl-terminal processing protease
VAAMLRSLDPYTEFEGVQEAVDMTESIEGKYGGVGLVIASRALGEPEKDAATSPPPPDRSIRVVSAFEGYAFDYGMRVGDTILAVDDVPVQDNAGKTISIDQVRSRLRGPPGTTVRISFLREGLPDVQHVEMPRSVVQIRDVKLATLLGNPTHGIGYIQLSGFASDAGREMRQAIAFLQKSAEDAAHGERSLQGLILDLRGNPGGLLTSAVDVASLLVPKGSDIVSAKGRGFPGILYRSRTEPLLDTKTTKLAVLVNGNTASAAEIVSGAVQDLDVGIIVGTDRTFGKGLVQNVEELPYNTALKFTVAKYYTPSGRCIQGVQYAEGDRRENDGKYVETKIAEKDRGIFYTRLGRVVRDGGGVEADYKIPSTKASALEMTLYRSNVFADFAAEWSRNHELTDHFSVDEDTYKSFQAFVQKRQKSGELQLEALYGKPLEDLKKALSASGYSGSEKSVEQLQARIVREIQDDFDKYRNDIKEDISQSILARYVPESMLIERGIQRDPQVEAAIKLLSSPKKFDRLLAKGSVAERTGYAVGNSLQVAVTSEATSSNPPTTSTDGFRSAIKW